MIHQKDVLIHNLQNRIHSLELDLQTSKLERSEVQTQREGQSPARNCGDSSGHVEEEVREQIVVGEHGVQQELSVSAGSIQEAAELHKRHEMTNSLAIATNRYELATSMLQSWEDGAKLDEAKTDKPRRGKRTRRGTGK